jgi:hypothetical protein
MFDGQAPLEVHVPAVELVPFTHQLQDKSSEMLVSIHCEQLFVLAAISVQVREGIGTSVTLHAIPLTPD